MNKIEQRVQRYKEDLTLLAHALVLNKSTTVDNILQNQENILAFLQTRMKMENKMLADIVTLSKTL
jgi:translation elongation factor EF-Ts